MQRAVLRIELESFAELVDIGIAVGKLFARQFGGAGFPAAGGGEQRRHHAFRNRRGLSRRAPDRAAPISVPAEAGTPPCSSRRRDRVRRAARRVGPVRKCALKVGGEVASTCCQRAIPAARGASILSNAWARGGARRRDRRIRGCARRCGGLRLCGRARCRALRSRGRRIRGRDEDRPARGAWLRRTGRARLRCRRF